MLVKSLSKYFCGYFFRKCYFTQKKTTVIRIIFNLERLKRHIRCVDLENFFISICTDIPFSKKRIFRKCKLLYEI